MAPERKRTKANRFKRIAGQVQGIANMILDDRYCIEILHQIQAVKSALARAESEVLRDHAACCVAEAIKSGNSVEQKIKLDEIVALFDKAKR